MSRQKIKLKWCEPLNLAQKIADNYRGKDFVFLNSGLNDEVKNSRSFIALFAEEKFVGDDLNDFSDALSGQQNQCFGYISYENENPNHTKKSFINLPKIYLANFALIFEFNHDKKLLSTHFSKREQLDEVLNYKTKKPVEKKINVTNFDSNFSDKKYLQAIDKLKQMIACGDFYQVNLTRKFFGNINLKTQQEFFSLFAKLDKTSPANYSSFLKLGENFIISSSPELFLSIKNSIITSRPIKGTAPRNTNKKLDNANKKYLQNSAKEKAENLMIVDLVRNDLSRICKASSVVVKNLFKVNSYKTLHHMSSEISGKIAPNFSIIDCLKALFPAGSMTGAPKIKAMEVIAQNEKINRGVYSGAIGYLSASEANFSVVIRTLICQKNKFEFQVGGAITFDSDPQKELEEIFTKAKAITKILNLKL